MKSILAALKPPLLEMLGSKKVLAGLSGVIVLIGSSALSLLHIGGLEPDPAMVDRYIVLVIAYIAGQSVVDHGKSAAVINAKASTPAVAVKS